MIRFALPCICYKIIFIIHIVILIVLYYQHIRLNWMEQNGIKCHPCSTVSKAAWTSVSWCKFQDHAANNRFRACLLTTLLSLWDCFFWGWWLFMASSIKSNRQVNLPMTIIVESWNLQVYFDWGSHIKIKCFEARTCSLKRYFFPWRSYILPLLWILYWFGVCCGLVWVLSRKLRAHATQELLLSSVWVLILCDALAKALRTTKTND